jgi:flagellar motility protein MotE (MotC chaperone)
MPTIPARQGKFGAVIAAMSLLMAGAAAPALAQSASFMVAESAGHGAAVSGSKKDAASAVEPAIPPSSSLSSLSPAENYCAKVSEVAAQSQFAQQRKALAKAQEQVDARIKMLAEKSEELRVWIKKREDFLKTATEGLLQIYGKMKPELAAPQLLAMSQPAAAAILAKLPPKTAGAILAEMDATRAARLSSILTGAVQTEDNATPPTSKEQP